MPDPYVTITRSEDLTLKSIGAEELLAQHLPEVTRAMRQQEDGERSHDFKLRREGWTSADSEEYDEEVGATVRQLLELAAGLMRSERLPVPNGAPAGRLLYSISRTPNERGSTVLRWWIADDGTTLVGSADADFVTPSAVNFGLGVPRLLDRY